MRRRSASLLTRALVATTLLAGVLTGCASIPTSGDVQANSATPATEADPFIRVLAREPRPGATPTEIVAGFLTASASLENDHAVARSYLTEDASAAWRPDVGVTIYQSDPGYRLAEIEPGRVQMLALRQAGALDERGVFSQPVGNSQFRAQFGVRKADGQWRIAVAPNGLILSTADVSRAYRALNLYYLDIAGGVLVPDPVFLPTQQPGLSTVLVRQLLLGPTSWIAPAVRTAIPPGTRLSVDAVPVIDGIARVDLAPSAVEATGDDRRALAAQITYTLAQLPDVTGVRITLNGVPLTVPGIGTISRVSDWESFDPDAAPADGSTYAIDQGHLASITTLPSAVAGYFGATNNLTSAAVSPDGKSQAGVVPDGSGAQVRLGAAGAADAAVVHRGRLVSSVSFDRFGEVWFPDRADGRTKLWIAGVGRARREVQVAGLGSRSIETLRISRDGARVAVIVAATAGGPGQLLVGRVQRESDTPIVSGLRRVESELTVVDDVAWADASTMLVVGRRAGEPVQSYTVGIDGYSLESAGSVPSMLTVAACPGRPYLAGTATGTLWADRGTGWRAYVQATTPVYPG